MKRRWRTRGRGGSLFLAIALVGTSEARAQSAADSAWVVGDLALAERLYTDALETDGANVQALHRLDLIRGWSERYRSK